MWFTIVKRLMQSIPTLLVLLTLTFFLIRLAPGGPFDTERVLSPQIQAAMAAKYHLDEPLIQQYGRYLSDVLQGNLGPSYLYKDFTVNQLIASGFPVSLTLGGLALLVAVVLGVAVGSIAAVRKNSFLDYALMGWAVLGISIPNFVIAPFLILICAVTFDLLPAGGWNEGQFSYLILPIISLSLPYIAYIARLVRGSMLEVLNQDYIRTARAKGLSNVKVIFTHALRPAMLPVVSFLGPAAVGLITGSVVIEKIFGIPGLGRYFVQGALNRDYTLVLGVVLFVGVLMVLFNLIVDVIYALINPKISQQHE